jgi:Ca-activated chloride channel family protein
VGLAVNLDEPAPSHKALVPVWARAKIASLYDRMAGSSSPGEIIEMIRDVALRHGIVSDFTAFVAVDSLTRTAGEHGTTVPVAVPVPTVVSYRVTVARRPSTP